MGPMTPLLIVSQTAGPSPASGLIAPTASQESDVEHATAFRVTWEGNRCRDTESPAVVTPPPTPTAARVRLEGHATPLRMAATCCTGPMLHVRLVALLRLTSPPPLAP